jgi:hypothetical protein
MRPFLRKKRANHETCPFACLFGHPDGGLATVHKQTVVNGLAQITEWPALRAQ